MDNFHKIKGVQRKEALPIEDVLHEYIRTMKLGAGLNTHRVFAAWDEVSGAGSFTLRKFYRDGILYVTLSSSMVRNQLEFQKDALVLSVNGFLEKDALFDKDCKAVGYVKQIVLK